MIEAILLVNKNGLLRFLKLYTEDESKLDINDIARRAFELISKSKETSIIFDFEYNNTKRKLLFRLYGSIYIIFISDESENELGILDFINLMMKIFDEIFKGVTEKDIIMNPDKLYLILDEMISGGMVIETDKNEIMNNYNDKIKD